MRVVVLGATGVVGTALVPGLTKSHDVVAISVIPRRQGAHRVAPSRRARRAYARCAFRSADVVVHLVHSLGSEVFEDADRRASGNVARAADRAGVARSSTSGGSGTKRLTSRRTFEAEPRPQAVLASGSTPVTTLRAAMVVGAGSAAFETIRALVDRLPAMVCPRWVTAPTQPVALGDVVATSRRRPA